LAHHQHTFLDTIYVVGFAYGMVVFYYFATVIPLPPGKSRIRRWFEKWSFGILKPASVNAK
jgi:hypothetical protein